MSEQKTHVISVKNEDVKPAKELAEGWNSLTHSEKRLYHYPDGQEDVLIMNPRALFVRSSGAHMVMLEDNSVVYVREGWRFVHWWLKDGQPSHKF